MFIAYGHTNEITKYMKSSAQLYLIANVPDKNIIIIVITVTRIRLF